MQLYLVRHAEALSPGIDPERPLSAQGRDQAENLATWCAARSIEVDAIVHSGVLRAQETAEFLARGVKSASPPAPISGLRSEDDPVSTAAWIAAETRDLLAVSHLPFVDLLTSQLIYGRIYSCPVSFRTCTLAHFEREDDGTFRLVASYRP